jgi:hypothetical protein
MDDLLAKYKVCLCDSADLKLSFYKAQDSISHLVPFRSAQATTFVGNSRRGRAPRRLRWKCLSPPTGSHLGYLHVVRSLQAFWFVPDYLWASHHLTLPFMGEYPSTFSEFDLLSTAKLPSESPNFTLSVCFCISHYPYCRGWAGSSKN